MRIEHVTCDYCGDPIEPQGGKAAHHFKSSGASAGVVDGAVVQELEPLHDMDFHQDCIHQMQAVAKEPV